MVKPLTTPRGFHRVVGPTSSSLYRSYSPYVANRASSRRRHAPSQQGRCPLILVVEDHPDTQSLVADFLSQLGWEVLVTSNGDTALCIMLERRPELVYLDVNLPCVSGYDVCEKIRSDPALKDTPILMTSAHNSVDVRAFSLEAGANAYLAKPYELDDLAAVVERLVRGSRPSREPAGP